MIKVFIDGQSGTTGLKIRERLLKRNDIELLEIDEKNRKNEKEISKYINESDITFLCLPDSAAEEAVLLLDKNNKHTKIIDASTAHRTLPEWAYGFPELSSDFRKRIETNRFIANPGCYASGFNAIIYPLVKHNIISKSYPVTCFAVSGYSGGGKKAIAEYESAQRNAQIDSPRQYALNQNHKHLKEMKAISGIERTPLFSPMICDYKQGMVVSIPLFTDMLNGNYTAENVREILTEHYSRNDIIKIRPEGYTKGMIAANVFDGRDDMEIEVNGNKDRFVITSRFDNLGKGASGSAIQCMNIACWKDEKKSLVIGE
ncbi:MAG: N-acetyl-gamma-glutamyl-phosphate reductase [Clostridiales bacterium]|nr:N-acetyl-gamma-glutamyl-phosphate reductase [Clostridiales bacterium]